MSRRNPRMPQVSSVRSPAGNGFPAPRWLRAALLLGLLLAVPGWVLFARSPAYAAPQEDEVEVEIVEGDAPALEDAVEDAAAESDESGGSVIGRLLLRALGISTDRDAAPKDPQFAELIGRPAPEFELTSLDGQTVSLKSLKGKVVVLDFWASWCGPCRAAMPKLEKVHTAMADQPVAILGVNVGEERATAAKVADQLEVTFPLLLDQESAVSQAYSVTAIPQTVIIDKQGILQAVHQGNSPNMADMLTREIKKLLEGQNLYDAEQIEQARTAARERQEQLNEALELKDADRLVRGSELVLDPDADLLETDRQSLKITLPGDKAESFVMITPELKLAVVRPAAESAELIELDLDESFSPLSLNPLQNQGVTQWLVMGEFYDEDTYDVTKMELHLFDDVGDRKWTYRIDPLEGDSILDAYVVAADILGDPTPEILVLEYHDAIAESLPEDEYSARVLTVLDAKGKLVLRATVPGYGSCGMEVLKQGDTTYLLMATTEGITRFSIKP